MATTRKPRRDKGSGNGSIEWRTYADGTGCWVARLVVDGRPQKKQLIGDDGQPLTEHDGDKERARELTARLAGSMRALPPAPPAADATLGPRATVRQFGEQWTSGKLFARHGEVRKLRMKASSGSDETRLEAHVYPHIGDKAVADVTDIDIEQCFAKAAQAAEAKRGKPWRQDTKVHLYQVTKRLFDLAIKPGRLRTDNPVSKEDHRPAKGKPKMFVFLYPVELLALLKCVAIPIGRRVHYALGCYTGLRKSSIGPVNWADIDFTHGTITALVTKGMIPLMFELQPDVLALLQAWHEHCGKPDDSSLVMRDLDAPDDREAETLRADLRLAGVMRALLFSNAPNVQQMRFHDLRATFVTWALRAGKGWGWITARTGHLTPAMMERYNRQATVLADLQYEPFPDLSDAIPELSSKATNVVRLRPRKGA
jgi:integrase